jgi:hypothetical protein
MEEYLSVPYHVNFKAKRLFSECGNINDCLVAIIGPAGGGTEDNHTTTTISSSLLKARQRYFTVMKSLY